MNPLRESHEASAHIHPSLERTASSGSTQDDAAHPTCDLFHLRRTALEQAGKRETIPFCTTRLLLVIWRMNQQTLNVKHTPDTTQSRMSAENEMREGKVSSVVQKPQVSPRFYIYTTSQNASHAATLHLRGNTKHENKLWEVTVITPRRL